MNSLPEEEADDEIISFNPNTRIEKSQGAKNKAKGSGIERLYANIFKQLHVSLEKCKTTRFTSKLLDNCKIDLNFLPILVQIKAGRQLGLSSSKVLQEMEVALKENLPKGYPEHKMPKIVIHHKDIEKGRNVRIPTDAMVHMTFDDWIPMFLAYVEKQENDSQTK